MTSLLPPGPSTDRFWSLIDASRTTSAPSKGEQLDALQTALNALSEGELTEFAQTYHNALAAAYRWDLWAAVYILNGGCGDDGFDYFRDWLIANGRAVYEGALADPETLAPYTGSGEMEFEDFRYVADRVFETKFGRRLTISYAQPVEPSGEPWDEETVETLFPKLAEAYRRHLAGETPEPAVQTSPQPAARVLKKPPQKKRKRRWWHFLGFGKA